MKIYSRNGVDTYVSSGYEITVAQVISGQSPYRVKRQPHHIEVMEWNGCHAIGEPRWYSSRDLEQARLYAFGLMVKHLQGKKQ